MTTKTSVRLPNIVGWKLQELPTGGVKRRDTGAVDPFAARLAERGGLELVQAAELRPAARRGAAAELPSVTAGPVIVETDTAPDELQVLMARHDSGAITFHLPVPVRSARRGAAGRTVRFSVPVSAADVSAESAGGRRGIITGVVRTFLFRVTGVVADRAMPALGRAWEKAAWQGRAEGWKRVTPAALASADLPVLADFNALSSDPARPGLLLLHGTFSHAAAAFRDLATVRGSDGRTLFEALKDIYEDRIFAFDHFTVSRSLAENVRMMLAGLPDRRCVFDVITHSRGGLVLRHLVELEGSDLRSRFALRRAVLVASPNGGTPLASPQRFDHFVTWIANLLDLFPDNPLTEGLAFVSEGLGWLAHRVAGALPGLAVMDSDGVAIAALQKAGAPGDSVYSALVSNFEPEPGLLRRMADAGVDVFFGSANDLVVPTEGGWRVNPGPGPLIPGARIGCFGSGGNLQRPAESQVSHISFFERPETVDFLARALRGDGQPLAPVDPAKDLPFLLRRRGPAQAASPAQASVAPAAPIPGRPAPGSVQTAARPVARFTDEVFHLSILDVQGGGTSGIRSNQPGWAILMASFRNARSVERLQMRGGEGGKRFQQIIRKHRAIRNYVNGVPGATELPHGEKLVELGCDLFEVLFPGDVRRLYDVARAEQVNRRINLIFTSQIAWLADLPWEFVYDPARRTFLATSEINFTRNVVTEIPGDRLPARSDALRILVVVAQPLGLAHLSADEEREIITSGFRRLIEAGLASVEVLLDATPGLLHQALETGEYDVLHFIGHGEYDANADIGYLVFEDEEGGIQKVDARILQQIICRRNIRLVFLNACESGEGGHADFNRGVAPALVQAGVPAVIGNQYSVLDVSATAFARHLYHALAQGRTIGDAVREARVAVNYLIPGEAIDWAVPVLFARDPTEQICAERGVPEVERERAAERKRTYRRATLHRIRVGLWDVQRIFPRFSRIAEALTGVQDLYAFEVVSIPAPLGTWRRKPDSGRAYLMAENIAERLRDKPKELGLDRLIAFTNLPMRDAETLDLYAWDEDPGGKISLFSSSGLLESLDPPKLSAEKMIINAIAGFLTNLPTHKTGARNCLSFYNEEREIELIAGHLQLCKRCLGKLDRSTRKAVEQMLRIA